MAKSGSSKKSGTSSKGSKKDGSKASKKNGSASKASKRNGVAPERSRSAVLCSKVSESQVQIYGGEGNNWNHWNPTTCGWKRTLTDVDFSLMSTLFLSIGFFVSGSCNYFVDEGKDDDTHQIWYLMSFYFFLPVLPTAIILHKGHVEAAGSIFITACFLSATAAFFTLCRYIRNRNIEDHVGDFLGMALGSFAMYFHGFMLAFNNRHSEDEKKRKKAKRVEKRHERNTKKGNKKTKRSKKSNKGKKNKKPKASLKPKQQSKTKLTKSNSNSKSNYKNNSGYSTNTSSKASQSKSKASKVSKVSNTSNTSNTSKVSSNKSKSQARSSTVSQG